MHSEIHVNCFIRFGIFSVTLIYFVTSEINSKYNIFPLQCNINLCNAFYIFIFYLIYYICRT